MVMIAANVNLADLTFIRQFVQEAALRLGARAEAAGDMVLAVNEAVANIITHGYQGRPGSIEITVEQEGTGLRVKIWDKSGAYNPLSAALPQTDLPLDKRPLGGMGLLLMHNFVDDISYQMTPEGQNCLTLYKHEAFSAAT